MSQAASRQRAAPVAGATRGAGRGIAVEPARADGAEIAVFRDLYRWKK